MKTTLQLLVITAMTAVLSCSNQPLEGYSSAPFMSQNQDTFGDTLAIKGKFFAYTFEQAPPNEYTGELSFVKLYNGAYAQPNTTLTSAQNSTYGYQGYGLPYQQQMLSDDPFLSMTQNLHEQVLETPESGAYYDLDPAGVTSSGGRLYITSYDNKGIENFRLVVNMVNQGMNSLLYSPDQPDFPVEAYLRLPDGRIYAAGADILGTDGTIYLDPAQREQDVEQLLNPFQDTKGYFFLQMRLVDQGPSSLDEEEPAATVDTPATTPTTTTPTTTDSGTRFTTHVLPALRQADCTRCHNSTENAGNLSFNLDDPEDAYYKLKSYITADDQTNPERSMLIRLLMVGSDLTHGGEKPIVDEQSALYDTLYWWIADGSK
ncbi:MAG: hypothetical protein A2284_15155 [Deltaproteobacteria bacterium RIFOXYA12_FULL_61_11]|nr:MAG: hypothetical protein A2284_15155 [Deltaproteobacteria bacterium RIFOXYA12_FULL_61_11]